MQGNGSSTVQAGLWLVLSLLVLGSTAHARIHGLSGNARFQIGDGLPLPIGFTAVPNGKVAAIPGATVMQHGVHSVGNPAKVVIDPFQLEFDGPPMNLAVAQVNPNLFQVHTNVTFMIPHQKVVFSAGGRTGAALVTFCGKSGSTVTPSGNPGCANGSSGTGLLRYTRTSNQFGGPAQANVGGSADIALRVANPAPCAGTAMCIVGFADVDPFPTGALGAPFGFTNFTTPLPPNPGVFIATVTAMGAVVNIGMALGPGLGNAGTSWGGPWTTGMVTASAPSAVPPELFQLTGMDGRAAGTGMGTLSLVAGGFSQRNFSGPNANRGWLNLTIAGQTSQVPLMPIYGVAGLVVLTTLSAAFALWRRGGASSHHSASRA